MLSPLSRQNRPGVMGDFTIREESAFALAAHGTVPIAFETTSRIDLDALRDPAGPKLVGIPMGPRRKDYDAIEGPSEWATRFDTARWGLVAAWSGGERIGGAVIAMDTAGVELLGGRRDLALVWDLRVAPEWRGRGVGRALWAASEAWARARECVEIRVETQDVNPAACRFYAGRGLAPILIVPDAYPGLDEAMILWGRPLA